MLRKTSNMEENESSISVTNSNNTSNATVNGTGGENTTHNTLQKPRYAVLVLDILNDFVYSKLKWRLDSGNLYNLSIEARNLLNNAEGVNISIQKSW